MTTTALMSKNKTKKNTDPVNTEEAVPLTCPQHPHFKTVISDADRAIELIPELLLELAALYHSGRILQAEGVLQTIHTTLAAHSQHVTLSTWYKQLQRLELQDDVEQLLKLDFELLERIRKESDDVRQLLQEFNANHDWHHVHRTGDGLTCAYKSLQLTSKKGKKETQHVIKLDGVIEAPVSSIVAVLMEVDLYTRWMPCYFNGGLGLSKAQELQHVDKFKKIAYFGINFPWPMQTRDLAVYGVGCDMLETGHVLCVLSSIDDREEFSSQVPPVPSKHVRATMSIGGFLLTPLSAQRTQVSFIFNVDPKMSYVPNMLLNWGLKQGAHMVFHSLARQAHKVHQDEQYLTRMEQHAESYGLLRSRFEQLQARETELPSNANQ